MPVERIELDKRHTERPCQALAERALSGRAVAEDVEVVGQLATAAFTLWFFLTPILYPASLVPEAVRTLQLFNPMIPLIDAYRSIILTGIFAPGITLVYSLGLAVVLLWLGNYVFQRCRGFFADYL